MVSWRQFPPRDRPTDGGSVRRNTSVSTNIKRTFAGVVTSRETSNRVRASAAVRYNYTVENFDISRSISLYIYRYMFLPLLRTLYALTGYNALVIMNCGLARDINFRLKGYPRRERNARNRECAAGLLRYARAD